MQLEHTPEISCIKAWKQLKDLKKLMHLSIKQFSSLVSNEYRKKNYNKSYHLPDTGRSNHKFITKCPSIETEKKNKKQKSAIVLPFCQVKQRLIPIFTLIYFNGSWFGKFHKSAVFGHYINVVQWFYLYHRLIYKKLNATIKSR